MKEFKIAIRLRDIEEDFQPTGEREIYIRNSESTIKQIEHNGLKYEFYCEKLEFDNGQKLYLTHEKSKSIDDEIIKLIKTLSDFVPSTYFLSTIRRSENWLEGSFYHDTEKQFTNFNIISNISKGNIKMYSVCQAKMEYLGEEGFPDYDSLNDHAFNCMSIIQKNL